MVNLVYWKRQGKSQTEEGREKTKAERKKLLTNVTHTVTLEERCPVSHGCWKYKFPVFVQKETSLTVVWKTGEVCSKGVVSETGSSKRRRERRRSTEILTDLLF